ncbi:Stealth CR1 domain-containing protein [Pontimicrobium aquaticum]|uniref:Capsular biosynthesis protein n=1 Tax=Pontimicrobium aquaticum TaxID=2565367 RepID=A0A4U0ERD3_9FLAO|nr:Stealth CR1 domain-containing protein [Pontimicrobium aquaticum]TJY32862.1 capsular biosynthesis protein [Pontimicrobium aquaticum]
MIKQNLNIQIDAVITWVDGSDTEWQKKINTYSQTKIDFKKKKESVRYNSIGEIDIAIRSIIKFASFIKNIYLVTDNQKPENFEDLQQIALEKQINLTLVDHKVIFKGYEKYLPCFNSCSIGSVLYRIPNLSEHFIIFNDDTFLMRETKPSDFFINKEPIIRGQWKDFYENQSLRKFYHKMLSFLGKKKKKGGFKTLQQTSAKLAGTKKYVRRFHTPVPVRRLTLENFFKTNNVLESNIKHRFRNNTQFIVSSLSEHLEIKNNSYHYKNNAQLTYFRSYKYHFMVVFKLFLFSKNKKKLFMTFQCLEMAEDKTIDYVFTWINKKLN